MIVSFLDMDSNYGDQTDELSVFLTTFHLNEKEIHKVWELSFVCTLIGVLAVSQRRDRIY